MIYGQVGSIGDIYGCMVMNTNNQDVRRKKTKGMDSNAIIYFKKKEIIISKRQSIGQ